MRWHAISCEEQVFRGTDQRNLKPLEAYFNRVARPALEKHGAVLAELLRNWPAIAGPVAEFTRPEALKRPRRVDAGATLKLRVQPGRALELQHMTDALIARINGYFGHLAVERVTFVQAPVTSQPDRETQEPLPPPDRETQDRLLNRTGRVHDDSLRESLRRLAEGMARKKALKSRKRT